MKVTVELTPDPQDNLNEGDVIEKFESYCQDFVFAPADGSGNEFNMMGVIVEEVCLDS